MIINYIIIISIIYKYIQYKLYIIYNYICSACIIYNIYSTCIIYIIYNIYSAHIIYMLNIICLPLQIYSPPFSVPQEADCMD